MPTEQIWVVVPKTSTDPPPVLAFAIEADARRAYCDRDGYHSPEEAALLRPDLRPIYGGETLLEALWSEMDRLMEGLMTDQDAEDVCGRKSNCEWSSEDNPCQHEDNGDRYRAQELAWVLAIVTNPYNPSVDAIRAEAVARWNTAQEES